MVTVELFKGSKRIPSVRGFFEITNYGKITDSEEKEITLEEFIERTGCWVSEVAVLAAVTYQKFNWPPIYWKHLVALRTIEGVSYPETIVLGVTAPVESLEYPGYYMIPYFSNYVISEDGTLLRRNGNRIMVPNEGVLGYRTFRMLSDADKTMNALRHRILCYAFKPYPANVEELDVNHKNCVPGDDFLDNLEWATRSENMVHAYQNGLRTDNKPVEVRDVNTGEVFVFASCSAAGRSLSCTETTVSNRAKLSGFRSFGGMQYRFYSPDTPWPVLETSEGKYLIEFPDKSTKLCDCNEAARLAGLTRTSLLRALREGRCFGSTGNKVTRL